MPENKKAAYKRSLIYLFIGFLVCGYMYFFSDRSMYFECQKKTMTCTYSHSTEYDKTIRPVATYGIAHITHAKIVKHKRSKSGSYYTVEMYGRNGKVFKIPYDFSSRFEAQAEEQKFNRFLSSRQNSYLYISPPAEIPPVSLIFGLCLFFSVIVLVSFLNDTRNVSNTAMLPDDPDMDAEIRKDLKEEGMSDAEIDAFLKQLNEEAELNIDEEIRKGLKKEGMSDAEIDASLKGLNGNKDLNPAFSDPIVSRNDDVIQRTRKV